MGEVILKIENGTKKFKNELIFQNAWSLKRAIVMDL